MAATVEQTASSNAALPLLQSFVQHYAKGELDAALQAASDACHAAPGQGEAHYAYGQAWLAKGEAARAEQAFAAALRIRPDWADAWVNFGIARYKQGAIGDAKTAMRRALAAAPAHAAAAANLGAFMRISGEGEGAEALLRQALTLAPDNTAARLNLAADMLEDERPGEVLALLDDATRPADITIRRHWHLQRSLALLNLGQPAEARVELDSLAALGPVPPALMPLWHWRQVLLALREKRPAAAGAAAERMEASLATMGPDAVLEHRIMARYDLAKFWSTNRETAIAFRQWQEGHKLLRTIQPFSRDAHEAFIDASIARLNAARLRDGPRASNADKAPVFIVGMPRSGTTLCEQILAAHAQVHGAGERGALGGVMARLGGETPVGVARLAALDQRALDDLAQPYLAALHALAPDKAVIVDKMPANHRYAGLAALMLPGARIIHCTRDPRDIGLSIFTFRFHGDHGYAHDLADLGWTIAQQVRLMEHWKQALPDPVLTVRLSDWVHDFDGTLARVLGHVGLPDDPACARFYEAESRVRTVSRAQVRQPVNARGLGRWKAYAPQLAPLIAELEQAGALEGWQDADAGTVVGEARP